MGRIHQDVNATRARNINKLNAITPKPITILRFFESGSSSKALLSSHLPMHLSSSISYFSIFSIQYIYANSSSYLMKSKSDSKTVCPVCGKTIARHTDEQAVECLEELNEWMREQVRVYDEAESLR